MANVSMARPNVAVRKAGFVNSPRNVVRLGCGVGCDRLRRARVRAHPAVERGDHKARNGADEKRRAPAPVRAHLPAGQVAERRAYGNRDIENGEDAIAIALGIEVGQHGRGEDAESGLADADQRVADIERPVVVDPGGAERGEAPQNRAGDDQRLAARNGRRASR